MSENGLITDLNVKRSSRAFLFVFAFRGRCLRCLGGERIVWSYLRVWGNALVCRRHCDESREVETGLSLVIRRGKRLKLSRFVKHPTSIVDP